MQIFLGSGPVSAVFPVVCFAHGERITGVQERGTRTMLGMMIALLAVLFVVLPVVFVMIVYLAAVFSGLAVLLAAGVFSGNGILPGFVLGLLLVRYIRKTRRAERAA